MNSVDRVFRRPRTVSQHSQGRGFESNIGSKLGFFFRSSLRRGSNSVDRGFGRPRTVSQYSRGRGFNSIVGWCALAAASTTPLNLHSLYKLAGQADDDWHIGNQTLAPEYSDAGSGTLTLPQPSWRMRRHFWRVEGKLRARKQVPSIVERPAPPPEPPPRSCEGQTKCLSTIAVACQTTHSACGL